MGGVSIPRASGHCCVTRERLEPGAAYVAALVEPPGSDELVRLDFAAAAWSVEAAAARGHVLGYWRGVVAASGGRPRLLIDDAGLMDFFEQLAEPAGAEGGEPKRAALRYVLALILVRRRLCSCQDQADGTLLLRRRADGAEFRVPDPGLASTTIAQVAEELGQVIAGEAGRDPGPGVAQDAVR